MLYSVVKQLRRRHGRPPLGSALRAARAAGIARGARPGPARWALGRRPGRNHDLLDRRRPLRLHAALGPAAVGRGAGRLPRARRTARARHGQGPGLPRPLLVRHAHGGDGGRDARRREPGHDLRRVRGGRGGLELAGISRYLSVPAAAVLVGFVVLRGSFHRVEHVLLLLSAVFVTYVGAAFLAHPDWAEAGRGLVVPQVPHTRGALIVMTGIVGTTLAPWGLAFIQSYAADKRLTQDRPALRADRRRLGRRADGGHRRLRADRLRRDAARDRPPRHQRRPRRRRRLEAARGTLASDPVRSRPGRRCPARGRRRAALDRLLRLRGLRPRGRLDDSFAEAPFFYSPISASSAWAPRSSSSPACR